MRICYRVVFALTVLFVGSLTRLAGADAHPVLRQVEQALKPLVQHLEPPPTFEYPSSSRSLIVSFRPQTYQIHPRSKRGERFGSTRESVGPSFTGFILKVHLQDKGLINQAMTPQTIREPYWKTLLDVTPIAGSEHQVYWGLSSCGRTDVKLLEQLRKGIDALAEPERPRDQVGEGPGGREVSQAAPAPTPKVSSSTLEGVLRKHPKYLFRYYLSDFADGQQCALFGEDKLRGLEVGSHIRVSGPLGVHHHAGGSAENPSPFPRTSYIAMEVEKVVLLGGAKD